MVRSSCRTNGATKLSGCPGGGSASSDWCRVMLADLMAVLRAVVAV